MSKVSIVFLFMYFIVIIFAINIFKKFKMAGFNLASGRWGNYGPNDHKQPFCLYTMRARLVKVFDYVPLYVSMVAVE